MLEQGLFPQKSTPKTTAVETGKSLSVDILVQGVQAAPETAVRELWGATISANGTLTPKGTG